MRSAIGRGLRSLRFDDPELERSYADDLFEKHQRKQVRVGWAIVVVFAAAMPLLDRIVVADAFASALWIRLGLVLPIELACFAVAMTRHARWSYNLILNVGMLVGFWGFLYIGSLARPPASYLYLAWPAIFACPSVLAHRCSAKAGLITMSSLMLLYVVMELTLLHSPRAVVAFMLVVYSSGVGIVTWLAWAGEQGTRELFLQERELAAERARSEQLLKQELGHQVAARSRELGKMLAGATLVPGKPRVGERFDGRYRVERELGAGAMGAVFEVVRTTDDARLALKVVTGEVSADRARRFAREAEIGAKVRHPNLVEIVDVGVADGGVPYLAMELAPRGSLEACRDRFGDAAWARPILRGIAGGLSALHDAGVVHRDLKPANVLLLDRDTPKISDFGISRFGELEADVDPSASTLAAVKQEHLTATGMLLGTPYYMAPEAVRRADVEAPADVFAFGILAIEMLTGRAPFSTPPMMRALAGEKLEPPTTRVDGSLGLLLASCLAEDPAERPTMRALHDALR